MWRRVDEGSGLMRASVLTAPFRLEVHQVPVPRMEPGDVLVEVSAVGLCGSDVHFYEHGRVGDLVASGPLILGHEAAGRIVAAEDAENVGRIGERVAVEPQRPCRRCRQCRAGSYNLCPSMRFHSAPPENGAFAQYLTVPSDFAHWTPDSINDDEAALLEPLSVGIAAIRKANVGPGTRVLIAGAGPIGVLSAAAARAFGAAEVIVVDPVAERLDIALAHGATAAVEPRSVSTFDSRMDAFIDASGARLAIQTGLRCLRNGGTAVLVGMGSPSIELDLYLLQSRELTMKGLFRYVDTWPTAIHLVASGLVRVDDLVTARGGLNDLETFMRRNRDSDVMKFIIDPRQ